MLKKGGSAAIIPPCLPSALRLCLLAGVLACCAGAAGGAVVTLENDDWQIDLTDYGYSDILLDSRPGFVGRELLSGEWAAALRYTVGGVAEPVKWLTPNFIYPDWQTNSDFSVVQSITPGPVNADGLPTASSSVANAHLQVDMDYELLDTITGIEQGATPASGGGTPASVTSNRYILKQTYHLTNVSDQAITQLKAFQFVHALNSELALYDNRNYGGPWGEYRYDLFQIGQSWWTTPQTGRLLIEDIVTLHSSIAPSAWEVGPYGYAGADSHEVGKPGVGVHWSVETDSLDGTDLYDPGVLWVSGAQRYDLPDLDPNQSTSFDVLLSIRMEIVPEPATLALLAAGAVALLRRRTPHTHRA